MKQKRKVDLKGLLNMWGWVSTGSSLLVGLLGWFVNSQVAFYVIVPLWLVGLTLIALSKEVRS